jgi:hypothetical protein
MRSCGSAIAFLFALVLGLFGSCFLIVGAMGASDSQSWGYGLAFALSGALLLYGAYAVIRATFGRRE